MNGMKRNIRTTTGKKDTITLAIDDNVLGIIKNDAELHGLSINSKINNILTKYAYFGKFIELQYPTTFTSRNMQFILDNLDETTLAKMFKNIVLHLVPPNLLEKKGSLTLKDWIKYICEGTMLFSGMIQKFSHRKDEDNHLYMGFTHNHGIKWSRIISLVITQLLSDFLDYHATPTVLENSVTLKVLETPS
jgi:hypothetical protein